MGCEFGICCSFIIWTVKRALDLQLLMSIKWPEVKWHFVHYFALNVWLHVPCFFMWSWFMHS